VLRRCATTVDRRYVEYWQQTQARQLRSRPVLSASTASALQEFLGFRHVVRSVCGYELDPERIAQLLRRYPQVWRDLEQDLQQFRAWLRAFADQLETSPDWDPS
jgi:hypothetical protein